ncbi:unnamed protein product, partial [Urochloa humidicola]
QSTKPILKGRQESMAGAAPMVCAKCKICILPLSLDDSLTEFSIQFSIC